MAPRISLLDYTSSQLEALLADWGQPRYRAAQVRTWLFRQLVHNSAEMTNLPASLRNRLAAETVANPLEVRAERRSQDGETIKWLFALPDALTIETVLMRYDERQTVCVSTQAGCGMGCAFCATGQSGLARNLTAGEIVAQVLAAARWLAHPPPPSGLAPSQLTNVVLMGMGEPLANYPAVWRALATLTDPDGFGLGVCDITLSTVGLAPGIIAMAEEPLQVNLAVSLHAPNDALRGRLAPVAHRYPLPELMDAVGIYIARTHRRVTFEYALMDGVNDSPELAHELAALLQGVLCHVNLIPLNAVEGLPYRPSPPARVQAFQATLERAGIGATLRLRRGVDIEAGCGQLRRRVSVG